MSDNNALVSRQASPSSAPVAMQSRDDVLMNRAIKISKSPPDMLPKQYRNNPGACLLLADWADRNDVAILEALGHVGFAYGKAVIEAVLQKKMAARHGYRSKVIATSDDEATVAIIGPDGTEEGRCKYTWQMAQDYGIHLENPKNPNVWKSSWKADRAHMLVKRATTRALEYYGPSELAPMLSDTDDNETDAETRASNSGSEAIEAEQVADTAEPAPETGSEPTPPSEDELRALAKQHKLTLTQVLKTAQQTYPEDGLTTMEALAAHPKAAFTIEAWIRQQ